MKYLVRISPRAWQDADAIYDWLAKHSVDGASRWFNAMLVASYGLAESPFAYGLVLDDLPVGHAVRQHVFKTPHGRPYRIVFMVSDINVLVLRIRGPGQPPISQADIDAAL
jgi:plasmid stabilization system protein ParE